METVNRIAAGAEGHRPCLTIPGRGPEGLEVWLQDEVYPPVLLEANTLLRSDQRKEARACLDQSKLAELFGYVTDHPWRTDIMYVAAKLLWEIGLPDQAETLYLMILARETHPIVYADLARLTGQDPTRQIEAMTYWQRACETDPHNVDYLQAHACLAREMGDVEKAVALQQQAIDLAPERHVIRCQLLWSMNCLPAFDRSHLHEQAKQWARMFTRGIKPFRTFHNRPVKTKRLKLGIVSGNFIENSPLTFFQPGLMAMDRERFELFAYSNVSAHNRVADQVVALFDVLRDIRTCSDQEAAALIRADGIDILIAFEGNCANSRLGVFALKPAPIQADWGGLSTLGLPQIDYRLTDDVLDPPDAQRFHTEALVYLSGTSVTYQPPSESPAIGTLPAYTNGFVTFGSFNSYLKINDLMLDTWSRILQRMPQARMVFKSPGLERPCVQQFLLQRLRQRGIHADRITMCAQTRYGDYLSLLSQVDLLLDTYPFNGFRTTLEGLWMGVPTISLSGTTFVSRMGLTIMKKLGWAAELVAPTPQAYIERACAYADQWEELACLRRALRGLLLSSSLCDPGQYARSLEQAFRHMWQQWCERQDVGQRQYEW